MKGFLLERPTHLGDPEYVRGSDRGRKEIGSKRKDAQEAGPALVEKSTTQHILLS